MPSDNGTIAPPAIATWEATLSIGQARVICELISIAFSEGQGAHDEAGQDALMRAIAWQHPQLVEELSYLPWPMKAR